MNIKKIPLRQCVGCREMKPKKELIRVIKTPEDIITIDKTGKQNGRGAYICDCLECFQKAVRNKGLDRSLGIAVPKDVYETLEKELI